MTIASQTASSVASDVASIVPKTLNEALTVIINKSLSGIDSAVGFMSQQIPDVIHQLLMWEFVSNALKGAIWLGLGIILALLANKCVKIMKEENESDPWGVFAFFGWIFAILFGGISLPYFFDALKIWIAPKVFLIEYVAQMVK